MCVSQHTTLYRQNTYLLKYNAKSALSLLHAQNTDFSSKGDNANSLADYIPTVCSRRGELRCSISFIKTHPFRGRARNYNGPCILHRQPLFSMPTHLKQCPKTPPVSFQSINHRQDKTRPPFLQPLL